MKAGRAIDSTAHHTEEGEEGLNLDLSMMSGTELKSHWARHDKTFL